ncbi:MAG: ECF transporter S component [Clostridia bacterium]|nr:ECF transporter S component [Clostridia bacterium]
MSSNKTKNLTLSAAFLALALVLPFLTGQLQQIGNMLLPMHIPVLLCGFFCGPVYGLAVGFIAPLLRFALFGMPPVIPIGLPMAFELLTYGAIAGILYKKLPKKPVNVFVALIVAMLAGRAVWGVARVVLLGLGKAPFGWAAFLAGAFTNAIPGIIIQLVLIPLLVIRLDKVRG